ncbi:FAD-binding and (Fe-S)-binding domain-containing protein [Aureivirga sp. CE67]|uniref:FAD-binding and (Fe-S)-binding domain-containing protein n=1 Tax=Aureivirga sp. CE67 TaxID=1788983 RepID=UPI0018CA217C|nr:FAD-binding and (Fe-S)-binding domain-containing protein [Aureivirga sp. CE67]
MKTTTTIDNLKKLIPSLDGELHLDNLHKDIYATDASVYRKIPLAVFYPKTKNDIKKIIQFAEENQISITPRTAGTSLAGQAIGHGIIVDTSKHFNQILEFDEKNKTITVEPGIVRDELNVFLKPYGLFFSPITSTANRCMIGGMVGNNSSGTTSIKYGVTRDKVKKLKCILSDSSEVVFSEHSEQSFIQKGHGFNLENKIYNFLHKNLSNKEIQTEIDKNYPKKSIHRRNTGYAIDILKDTCAFTNSEKPSNIASLLCGSEGTLAFTTEITLQLDDLPPKNNRLIAAHFHNLNDCMNAVVIAMKHDLYLCELMDKRILDCTKTSHEHQENRFFLEGDPEAILMLELRDNSEKSLEEKVLALKKDLEKDNLSYALPILKGHDIDKVIELRAAGLGLLGSIIGDKKAVACIEDTAVTVEDLPAYIRDFDAMMKSYNQEAIYYAHAGAGEIHLRPILNLKKEEDVVLFHKISEEVAKLVLKYNGSLSGEHGDGIVRSSFIPMVLGQKNYTFLKEIKYLFDPNNIFNPGKIIDADDMTKDLRYVPERVEPEIHTFYDYSEEQGILRSVEKCNGVGACRKTDVIGGVMCPSYRATKNEKDTTRARANMLREVLTNSDQKNPFDNEELKEILDLCLGCKACSSECPSNVDVATMKSEFLYQYYQDHEIPLRTKIFAQNSSYNKLGRKFSGVSNVLLNQKLTKKMLGIAPNRSMPKFHKTTFYSWYKKQQNKENSGQKIYVFCDEFTNSYDVSIGKNMLKLFWKLGYNPILVGENDSARSLLSKGFLEDAKKKIDENMEVFSEIISEETPLIGIEPSAILGFRDEFPKLATNKKLAHELAKNTFTFEEFFAQEIKKGKIKSKDFTDQNAEIKIHVHCHQKALSNTSFTFDILNLPKNYKPTILNSGCCGMAGSFGFEEEHFDISMKIGENSLFGKLRNLDKNIIISASGTSCRHQIKDGIAKVAEHPATILFNALKN